MKDSIKRNEQEEREQTEMVIDQLDQLIRSIFIWQIGLESMRFDGVEDIRAVLKIITRELRLIQGKFKMSKQEETW